LVERIDFNQILLESVDESIAFAMGQPISPALTYGLQTYIGLTIDEMTTQIDALFFAIGDSFGLRGDALCKMVVLKMYHKANIQFYEVGGIPMIQYVYDLKRKLAQLPNGSLTVT
jgi:hypothetical protein